MNATPPVDQTGEEEDAGQNQKKDAGVVDAGQEQDAGSDVDAGTPHPAVPESWGTPVAIQNLNTSSTETHPTMTGDQLRLCFSSDRTGGKGKGDIWCSFRDTIDDPWGVPVNQGNINSSTEDWMPCLSDDGTELFFASSRNSPGQMKIFRATWVEQAGGYGNIEAVSELDYGTEVWSGAPVLSKDGLTMFFESTRSGGYGFIDIYVTSRLSVGSTFDEAFNVAALNTPELDSMASPSSDMKTIVLTSERSGSNPWRSLWRSEAKTNGGWTAPVPLIVDGISSFDWMGNGHVLSDGSLLFNGSKKNSTSNDDLFIAPPNW